MDKRVENVRKRCHIVLQGW